MRNGLTVLAQRAASPACHRTSVVHRLTARHRRRIPQPADQQARAGRHLGVPGADGGLDQFGTTRMEVNTVASRVAFSAAVSASA
jgi:hypothetical protein